jgi:hypothetical protein
MTEADYAQTLDELDRLLHDTDVPIQPSLISRLLDKISEQEVPGGPCCRGSSAPGLVAIGVMARLWPSGACGTWRRRGLCRLKRPPGIAPTSEIDRGSDKPLVQVLRLQETA